jgi:hypothetical protein
MEAYRRVEVTIVLVGDVELGSGTQRLGVEVARAVVRAERGVGGVRR